MFKKIETIFTNKDLKNKITLTVGFLIIFRLISHIPVPWTNISTLSALSDNGLFSLVSSFSGGALQNFTFMATGISSYISASIIIQLFTYGFKKLHDIQKSPGGDKILKKYTIILGVVIAFITSLGTTYAMNSSYGLLTNSEWYVYLTIAVLHCIGTGIAIWIGETITQKGFGNGTSLLIFINILSSFPNIISNMVNGVSSGSIAWWVCLTVIIVLCFIFLLIVISELSQRQIPLLYSKRANMEQTALKKPSYFPIKLNIAGVMPIIFASTFTQVFLFVANIFSGNTIADFVIKYGSQGGPLYIVVTCLLIFIFSYFYTFLLANPNEIAKNIQTNGGCIAGVRPGKETSEMIRQSIKNVTFIGAIYLAIVALVPMIIFSIIGYSGIASTSLMILVGVAIETQTQFDSAIGLKQMKTF